MKTIGVIGAGSWGTALALTLSNKGHQVKMCDVNTEHVREMRENRENVRYLPGIKFSENLQIVDSAKEALAGADVACFPRRRSVSEAHLNRRFRLSRIIWLL